MGENLLTQADIEHIRGEIRRSVIVQLAAAPCTDLARDAAILKKKADDLFDERYSTTDAVRHAEIVAEQKRTESLLAATREALRVNVRNTYGIAPGDLAALIS